MSRRLIVHADDFGVSPHFNRGIVEGIKRGLVTSVSVLVNRSHVEPRLLPRKVSVGLHFELKEGENPRKALESQIATFRKLFGRLPSHIDGHLGAHFKPHSRKVVIAVARRLGLPVRSADQEQRRAFRRVDIPTPDHFVSSLGRTKEQVLAELQRIPEGVTEWMVHPGRYDPNYGETSLNREREKELGILKSRELRTLLRRNKVRLVNFRHLR